jgi:hypothetical protein
MLNKDMSSDHQRGFYEWLSQEWGRCSTLRGSFENHAVNYLMTTNGGAAAAVMAFAGSAGYATNNVYWILAAFMLGLLFAGCAIIAGYYRMAWLTKSLGDDHRAFNKGQLCSSTLEENHHQRFKKHGYGEWFGWLSFLLLITGALSSVYTFDKFMTEKTEKVAKEAEQKRIEQKQDIPAKLITNEPLPVKQKTQAARRSASQAHSVASKP